MREIYNVFLFTLRDNMRKRPFIITRQSCWFL